MPEEPAAPAAPAASVAPAAPAAAPPPPPAADSSPASSRFDVRGGELSLDQVESFPVDGRPSQPETEPTEPASPPAAVAGVAPSVEVPAAPAGPPVAGEQTQDAAWQSQFEQYVKETGLDPKSPADYKLLKRLTDKEVYIQKLQSERATPQAEQTPAIELTDFEKALLQSQQPQPQQQFQQPPPMQPQAGQTPAPYNVQVQQPPQPKVRYGDIGDEWEKPEDAFASQQAAWEAGDFKKLQEIHRAQFTRELREHLDDIVRVASDVFNVRFSSLPGMRENVERAHVDELREFAIQELTRVPAYRDLPDLFKDPGGPPLVLKDGSEYPNTPFNRLLVANPSLVNIRSSIPNPQLAERHSVIELFRAAHQLWKSNGGRVTSSGSNGANGAPVDHQQAQQLMQAGAEVERRTQQERNRQAINAGSGPGTFQNGQPQSYLRGLLNLPGDPQSLESIAG